MATYPVKTEISDVYPNPSNAVARVGFARLYDWIFEVLGQWLPAPGGVNAISVAYSPAITLIDGIVCKVRAGGANTITGVTFSPNGFTKSVKMNGNQPLKIGSIAGPDHELILKYNLANDVFELLNPALVLDSGDIITAIGVTPVTNATNLVGTTQAESIEWEAPQRGTITVDNDLSIDLEVTNNFSITPVGPGTLTFTNIATSDGQSGFIKLVNTANHNISAAVNTKIHTDDLAAISITGTYIMAYLCDGSNVYVMLSKQFT